MRLVGLAALILLFPSLVRAAVVINEVAWMGSAANANAEWIELTNTDNTPVDLTNWNLLADNGSPSITLTGSIAPGGYFLLERTSDATVPDITADQIYTGALANGGATLTLTNANGAVADQVVGGANWVNIGGDNATKQTAQRITSGWETAAGTPRALNAGASDPSGSATNTTSSTSATTSSAVTTAPISTSGGGSPEYLPVPVLRVITGGNRTVSLGADTRFTAVVYDSNKNKRDDALVTWSFGDGMQKTGASVFHRYYDPGEYVAVVHAATSDGGDALGEITVTVENANIRIASISARGITLANKGARPLDLSLWRLSMGGHEFKIPPDTKILAGRTILFPAQIIQLPLGDSASLLYPSGEVAVSYPASASATHTDVPVQLPGSITSYKQVQAVEPEAQISVNGRAHDITAVSAPAVANGLAAAGAALPASSSTSPTRTTNIFSSPWIASLVGIMVLAGGALIFL